MTEQPKLEELRAVAEAAQEAAETGGAWVEDDDGQHVGVVRDGDDSTWIAQTGASGFPAPLARAKHIATFSPARVISILDVIAALETAILDASLSDQLDETGTPLSWRERAQSAEASLSALLEEKGEGVAGADSKRTGTPAPPSPTPHSAGQEGGAA